MHILQDMSKFTEALFLQTKENTRTNLVLVALSLLSFFSILIDSSSDYITVGKMKILGEKRSYRYQMSLVDICILRDYPHCIDLWTKDHVKSFLVNENLNSLLPVFANMNGRVLHEMYTMCKTNRDSMFQTMKGEVAADGQQKPLTLSTYLCFLDEIQKYIPRVPGDKSQSSVICTLM